MKKSDKKSIPNFEDRLSKLESLVGDMESGNLTLEESLLSFEAGIKLIRSAQSALTEAEQKVQSLIEENGNPTSSELQGDAEA
jgi:exodeoxyribonuclease VII small subunit